MAAPYDQVIVLTGSFGSGKSTAARILGDENVPVISADEVARRVVERGSPVLDRIAELFGRAALTPQGELDRRYLAEVVFAEPDRRHELEELLHPLIAERAKAELTAALSSGAGLAIYDCPLFFEAGLEALGFREVVYIDAPEDLCLARAMARDSLTAAQARQRLASQLPPEQKRQRADTVIQNNGTLDDLRFKLRTQLERWSETPERS